ncbi:glucokinase [Pseudoxanthomonas dokdonensis]|uniref:Glucokinase n=1 Tax=Pseudoxanthomonas dokdonensis TaxID=344882 RepID=A0A0R0CT49_9GAMM|nr:glucokinase [Pseudoxanthomonas dokdonensis]KRG68804.1 glucokinase [Pseudoxanthomonas dokdonensis]
MSATVRVLLADIGGTNARFALADTSLPVPLLVETVRGFSVADFPSLAEAAKHYLKSIDVEASGTLVRHGVFAVAGRVDGDEARITNHPWVISLARTRAALGFDDIRLVNDFAAQAMAIPLLGRDDVVNVGNVPWTPDPQAGSRNYAILGPGTGLGVGGLILRDGKRYPLESEGGHVSFAPGTPGEIEVLQRLSSQFGRVSVERLICGPGLVNVHRAISEISGVDPGILLPPDVTARAAAGDETSTRAIDMFCAVFGAVAGDLVLTLGAWDGVFLTGGMVPKLLAALQHSGFRQRFEHKGRFSATMSRIPTLAIMFPHPGLLGASAIALEHYAKAELPARSA